VGLLDHMAGLCLYFFKESKFFSRVIAQTCIPTISGLRFLFTTSLPTHVVGGVFDDSYSYRGEVES
jgi:hypothetical protein